MFHELLVQYCEENDTELRNYSGRNYARDCLGIILPNGMQSVCSFIHGLTLKISTEAIDLQFNDKDADSDLLYEYLEDFVNGLEFDSMGRDEQVIYNREFKYSEFEELLKDGEEET